MKACVIVDQRGVTKAVFLTYALSKEELCQMRTEVERYKHTLDYIDVEWEGDACPFHIMIEKVFPCTQK